MTPIRTYEIQALVEHTHTGICVDVDGHPRVVLANSEAVLEHLGAIARERAAHVRVSSEDFEELIVTGTQWYPPTAPDQARPLPGQPTALVEELAEPEPQLVTSPAAEPVPVADLLEDTPSPADLEAAEGAAPLEDRTSAASQTVVDGRREIAWKPIGLAAAALVGVAAAVGGIAYAASGGGNHPVAKATPPPIVRVTPTPSAAPTVAPEHLTVRAIGGRHQVRIVVTSTRANTTGILVLANSHGKTVARRHLTFRHGSAAVVLTRLAAGHYRWKVSALTATAHGSVTVTAPPPATASTYTPPAYTPPSYTPPKTVTPTKPTTSPKPPRPSGGPIGING